MSAFKMSTSRHLFIILLSTLATIIRGDTEDLYSSTYQMSRLFSAEIQFVDALKSYAESTALYSDQVKKFVDNVYNDYKPAPNPEAYVANPLNALGVLKRTGFDYYNDLRPLVDEHFNSTEGLSKIKNLSTIFPDSFAYADACSGVSLLQEAYKLDAMDLAEGRIKFTPPHAQEPVILQSDFKIDWFEMFQIGAMACNRGWLDTGMTWLNLAMERAPKKARTKSEHEKLMEMKKERKTAIKHHDHYLEKRGPLDSEFRTFPIPFDEKLRKKKKYKKVKIVEKQFNLTPLFDPSFSITTTRDNFHLLCRDGSISSRSPKLDSKFICRYQHHSDPFLRLAPFKVEEINETPFIVVFHDIISETEMEQLKSRAAPELYRSEFGGLAAKTRKGLTRTSKQSWIHERYFVLPNNTMNDETEKFGGNAFILTADLVSIPDFPGKETKSYMKVVDKIVFNLSKRIGLATRMEILRPLSSELYQVANYGIGGQYNTHFDSGGSQWPAEGQTQSLGPTAYNEAFGDRIATFMGYIEDVPLGGATAFPMVGAAVQPKKGSAVFWLNLHPKGVIDRLSAHGGCPVLVGSKWITNKWIGGFDQWHYMKCGRSESDKFDLLNRWRQTS